ncbi:hypothetical protein ACLB2K_074149 [Fragaria x ananassa]
MARTMSHPLNYWRNYFGTAKDSNIFSIIDHAIKVAASDHPKGSLQRDRIVARLSSIQCLGSDEESGHGGCKSGSDSHGCEGLLEADFSKESNASDKADQVSTDQASQNIDGEVLKIKEALQNSDKEKADEASMLGSLTRLKMMTMTVETLEATAIGKVVSGLKKHGSKQIRDLARTLVDGWKVVVGEYLATQSSEQQSSLAIQNKNELEVMKKKQEVVAVKPNKAANNNERKILCLNDEIAVQAKIEATKRKLHESYEQIERTKRQRMVQVLDELPKQEHKVGSQATNRHGKKPVGSAQGRISNKLLKLKKQASLICK